MPVFALCDANNFYCSCERAFNPSLKGAPIVVLSNNDACVIARSAEAKALGIKTGDPWFRLAKRAGSDLRAFSSNYTLYGDMSRRICQVLDRFSPAIEPYSIDEMFLDLTGITDPVAVCQQARLAIRQETKIPACLGIGETKTIAKLANHLAKTHPKLGGVCDLRGQAARDALYPTIPITEVWGIGDPTVARLFKIGIYSVAQLAAMPRAQARGMMTVIGERLVLELRGFSCLPLVDVQRRKALNVTRTFGRPVTTWNDMTQAVSIYAARLAEKLREQGSLAPVLTVFIQTNRNIQAEVYCNYATFAIEPTQDTLALTADVLRGARSIWKDGFQYWKAGILAHDLIPLQGSNRDLLPSRDPVQSEKLMQAMDSINGRHGQGTVRSAVSGIERPWETKAALRSPRYTTRIDELMRVIA
jgi:DNA polymerase V